MKRIVCILLILALLPAGALPSYALQTGGKFFTDISDDDTQQSAELLHRLGIVMGTGGTNYSPGQQFNRAALAVISVRLSGVFDVSAFGGSVQFSDVRAAHWAHRWANCASSLGLMVGGADGLFRPEDPVTYGHLVTVLMRLLGYTDADVGFNWPHSYISRAEGLGMNGNMTFSPGQAVTRGQAARLICNTLFITPKGGTAPYIETVREFGASTETAVHEGKLVTLITDSAGSILAYRPDTTVTYRNAAVSKAQARLIDLTDGTSIPVPSGVAVWDGDGEKGAYLPASFRTEEPVTLVFRGSALLHILRGVSGDIGGADVIDNYILRIRSVGSQMFAAGGTGGDEYPVRSGAISMAHRGQIGRLTIDGEGYAIGFQPARGTTYRIITAAEARASGFSDNSGAFLPVPSATDIWTEAINAFGYMEISKRPYSAFWVDIRAGDTFQAAYNENGRLMYINHITLTDPGDYKLAIIQTRPAEGSDPLTDAFGSQASNAALFKNGLPASVDMLERWDVLMYYEGSDIIEASGVSFTGHFTMSPLQPLSVAIHGKSYQLLPEAEDSIGQELSGIRTFLFTHDGRIAHAQSGISQTTIGLAQSDGVLLGNTDMSIKGQVTGSRPLMTGRVGSVRGQSNGRITLTPFDGAGGRWGELNLSAQTLGGSPIAPWCVFYDQAGTNGRAVRVSRFDIPVSRVAAGRILFAQISASGYVTAIVTDNITGDSFDYGYIHVRETEGESMGVPYVFTEVGVSPDNNADNVRDWLLFSGNSPPREGVIMGIAATNAIGDSIGVFTGMTATTRHTGITRQDFNGTGSVRIDGRDVPIASGHIQVHIPSLPAGQRLMDITDARFYCRTFEVYTDPEGNKVRMIIGFP